MISPVPARHSVLFVCLGNICRSPTAEAVFRAMAQDAGIAHRLTIDSAGTGEWHVGNPPDWRAVSHAAKRGYDLTPLRARQVSREDFARFNRILAMDRAILGDLEAMCPARYAGRLGLFLDVAPRLGVREVPDPYDGGAEGFETVLDLVEAASRELAAQLAVDASPARAQ
ncbi:low molecular weight phosphotyrosine protein phosphatase [Burkholderiales bacterium]|nr:low molecular weight phosphotyrosine protein phosphatase [Burkholderiales bacterium]